MPARKRIINQLFELMSLFADMRLAPATGHLQKSIR
jgi:hypothetical protein